MYKRLPMIFFSGLVLVAILLPFDMSKAQDGTSLLRVKVDQDMNNSEGIVGIYGISEEGESIFRGDGRIEFECEKRECVAEIPSSGNDVVIAYVYNKQDAIRFIDNYPTNTLFGFNFLSNFISRNGYSPVANIGCRDRIRRVVKWEYGRNTNFGDIRLQTCFIHESNINSDYIEIELIVNGKNNIIFGEDDKYLDRRARRYVTIEYNRTPRNKEGIIGIHALPLRDSCVGSCTDDTYIYDFSKENIAEIDCFGFRECRVFVPESETFFLAYVDDVVSLKNDLLNIRGSTPFSRSGGYFERSLLQSDQNPVWSLSCGDDSLKRIDTVEVSNSEKSITADVESCYIPAGSRNATVSISNLIEQNVVPSFRPNLSASQLSEAQEVINLLRRVRWLIEELKKLEAVKQGI